MSFWSHHERLWHWHPAVKTGESLTLGERAGDIMKAMLATWTAFAVFVAGIITWMVINSYLTGSGHKLDPYPWILLNLCLSCFAGMQCFVLLIANKRGESIAAQIAQHTLENTQQIQALLAQNTELTELVQQLTTEVHAKVVA